MNNISLALHDKPVKPTSWKFAWVALMLWLFSMILPGIIFGSGERSQLGIAILISGWLSPIIPNFAWFANPLFLIAGFRVLTGRRAPLISLVAAILGLEMFRLASVPNSVQSLPVYGLGWGAIAWMCSLLLMMAAAGSLQREARGSMWWKERGLEWLKPVALVSLVALLSSTGYLSVKDRIQSDHFSLGLAFKR